ncbi:MAG: chromosomal replication initiator protein DnaA [Candidatus Saccharimonadales bacterium]
MPQSGLWQAVLGEVELSVSHGSFVTWFKNTNLLRQDGDVVIIGVPNVFIKQQLERKYADLLRDMLKKNGVSPKDLFFKIQEVARTNEVDERALTLQGNEPKDSLPKQTSLRSSSSDRTYNQGLNERYNFENFIVGAGNELAFAACQSVIQTPGKKYNPLYLYGGVGIGKTHLIQAVGNAVLVKNPDAKVLYISTEQFVREFVEAIRFKKTAAFASYYRTADVLIVDDVQFIAGKEKIQEEFFHTFNTLHQANKQIILSSDKQPRDIPTIAERLRSRFAWGMTIDMQNPDFETRCAIVQAKAQGHNVELQTDVTEYLATNIPTNIRELEGALNQLLAFCEMRDLEPNLSIVTSLLGSAKTRPKHLSAKHIVERTARHFQIPIEDILGPKRDKDIVVPRQVAMYMLRSELHLSFPKIAHELGRKDHTTAIHSVEKIENESRFDSNIRNAIADIKGRLYV